MKKIYLLTAILLLSLNLFSQTSMFEREVPQAVKKTLVEKYPDITAAEWFKNNDTVIEARFSLGKKKTAATFHTNGTFLSSSQVVTPKETPGMISNYIRGNHPNQVASMVMMTETADGKISYYVEIKQPGIAQAVTKLYFDFYGNLTKKIEPEEIKIEKDAEEGLTDDLGEDIASGQPIKKKELPSKVVVYIDKSMQDYKFEKAIFVENQKYGTLYEVTMRKLGYKEFKTLYFDLLGNLKVDVEK
ncbi:MAG: hypothetical protein BWY70_00206 [Bacteroidetes bacterium ADurb.Bin408]|nr:MAG: hypothetical protein BWY70_00206 [Bacteroidetes bacterium ADurb.Bin408]